MGCGCEPLNTITIYGYSDNMSNEIQVIARNKVYELGDLPNTRLHIYDKMDGTVLMEVTINNVLLYSTRPEVRRSELLGMYRGTIYAFDDKGMTEWELTDSDLRALFRIPDDVRTIAYQVFDCQNSIGSGCYSKSFAVDYYSKFLDLSPTVFASMLG